MAKRKKKQIQEVELVRSPRDIWIPRIEIIEEILLGLVVVSALWIFTTQLNSHFTLPKIAFTSLWVALLQVAWLARIKLDGVTTFLPRSIWLPLLGLVLWWLIATTQAVHIQTALEGQYGRYNALYSNLLYVFLFLSLCSMRMTIERLQRVVIIALIVILPVCLYAYVQYLGLDKIFNGKFGMRPPSSVGNPVALGTVLLMYFPFALLLAFRETKLQLRASYAGIALILISTLIISGSRGPWLGAIAAFMVIAGLLFLQRDVSRLFNRYTLIGIVAFIGIILFVISLDAVQSRISLNKAFDVRLMYYLVSIDVIADSPLFGFGFESFRLIYPEYRPEYDWQLVKDTTPTMIHNDYLQLAADNGLPAMIFYLFFIGGILYLLFRAYRTGKGDQHILVAMMAAISAYLVQANVGWLEAGSSIMYWFLLGITTSYLTQIQPLSENNGQASRKEFVVTSSVVLIGLIIITYYSILMFEKMSSDYALRKAQQHVYSNFVLSSEYIASIDRSNPDNFYYQDQLGLIHMKRISRVRDKDDYQQARRHLMRSADLNPHDAYVRIHIIENDLLAMKQKIIARPSPEAIIAAEEITKIDKNNPTVYRVAAMLYRSIGDRKRYRINIKRMRELKNYKWEGWTKIDG